MAITRDDLKRLLRYDRETGEFFWLVTTNHVSAGSIAGFVEKTGYRVITIKKERFRAHRLAWLYVHGSLPEGEVDHINREKDDNRIENLRVVDRSGNNRNLPISRRNTSGVVGVSWDKENKYWHAYMFGKSRSRINLGYFKCLFDAAAARKSAELANGFHENHGRALLAGGDKP